MFHTIEFARALIVDLEVSRKQPLERLLIHRGARLRAQVRPSIVETDAGPVEAADLFFEDGTAARMIAFACFSFVD